MKFYLKKILRHSAVYGVSNLVVSLASFILIPLYTLHLRPEEYGAYSIIALFGTVVFYIYDLGLINALIRYYFEFDAGDAEGKKRIVSTLLWFFVITATILSGLLLLVSGSLSALILGGRKYIHLLQLMIWVVFLNTISGVPITVLRMQERSALFMCLFVLKSIGIIAFSYWFLSAMDKGLLGVFQSVLIATAVFAGTAFLFTYKNYGFNFSFGYLGRMLKYGLPLCPAMLFSWVIDFSDRYFLRYFLSLGNVGIYSLGYRFGQIIYMVVLSFLMCWGPILFTIAKEKNARETVAKLSTYIASGFMLAALIVSLFSRELVALMAEASYSSSYKVVPLITLSYYLFGVYMLFLSGIQVSKKVYKQPFILGIGAAVNILLNILLIPRMGIMGAAVATVATYLVIALWTYQVAQRSWHVPYNIRTLALVTVSGMAIFGFSLFVSGRPLIYALPVKVFMVFLYPAVLFACGVFGKNELKAVLARIKSKSG